MALCIKKGAAIVALFSTFSVHADWFEDLSREPVSKHAKPLPAWVERFITSSSPEYQPTILNIPIEPPSMVNRLFSVPAKQVIKKGCRNEFGAWGFCDI
jgi:hypothetical protein